MKDRLMSHRISETKDTNRKFLKKIIFNFLNPDATKIQYDMDTVVKLLDQALTDITIQPTLLEIEAPTYVCGDINGHIADLRRIFHICGYPNGKRFLFLGNYVDQGAYSIEVVCTLFAMRLLFQDKVYLLRGNHELAHINKSYGFMEDINNRWVADPAKAKEVYRKFNEVFSHLPLAAVVSGKILCLHGGLSPLLHSLDDIRKLERPITTPKGLAQDILWADPQQGVTGFKHNSMRACSFNFGEKDVEERLKKMGLSKMIRAHQVVQFGWEAFANGRVITVFSASRYQADLYNYGGVIDIEKNCRISAIMFKPSDYDRATDRRLEADIVGDDKKEGEEKKEGEGEKKEGDKKDGEKSEAKPTEINTVGAKKAEGDKKAFTIEPLDVKWDKAKGEKTIKLTNNSADRQAIKMKCSDNALYRITPVFVFLEAGKSLDVKVERLNETVKEDRAVCMVAKCAAADTDPASIFKSVPVEQQQKYTIPFTVAA